MHERSDRRLWQRKSDNGLLLLIALLISIALTIVGLHSASASSHQSPSEATVSLHAPEWPFRGMFEPSSGRFWDTARMRHHDVGRESRLGSCFEDYVVVDESGASLGYTAYGSWPRSKHYVIPWGDIVYPTINSSIAVSSSIPVRVPVEGIEQRHLDAAAVGFDVSTVRAVSHGNAEDGGDYRWLVGFRITSSSETRWYRPYGANGGFVEHPAGMSTVEEFIELLQQSSLPERPRHYRDVYVSGTDGRYFGLSLYFPGHASCRDLIHTFIVDGATGTIVACHVQEGIQGLMSPGAARSLVFIAPQADEMLANFKLPSASSFVDIDNCPARIDRDPLSFFSAASHASSDDAGSGRDTRG